MRVPPPPPSSRASALVVLRPCESRILIGRAVAQLPPVQRAAESGRLVVVGSSTNRHVIRRLTGEDPGCTPFAVGWIRDGVLGESPQEGRGPGPFLFEKGKRWRGWPGELLQRFEKGDVYVKGANAIDPAGHTAVLMGSPTGGTIGAAMAILLARGGHLVIPVSLEKLIPSVPAACAALSGERPHRVMGSPVGLMPIMAGSATVITEVEALASLFGVVAQPVAAGGLADCAGSLTLHLSGSPEAVDNAWNALVEIRAEGDTLTEP